MLKYIGPSFLVGIPARDLTDAEVKQLGGKEKLLATGLYVEPEQQRTGKRQAEKDENKEGEQ